MRVLKMKGAKDPDEFIKKYGRDAFLRLLDQSENQVDYRLEQIQKKYNLEDDAQKVAFLQEAAQMLSTLPSAVEREIYGGHAAQTAGVTPETMALEVKKAFQQRLRKEKKKQEKKDRQPAAADPGAALRKHPLRPGGGGSHPAAAAGPRPFRGDEQPHRQGVFLSSAGPGV